jgi:DNA-binding beta-propeller fold protein YncE
MAHMIRYAQLRVAACAALALVVAGCAAPVRKPTTPVFFPGPPALPRIQYLVSFNGVKDIEEQSAFNRFVVGEKQDVRVDKAYGIAVYEGKIYVCDTNDSVAVFDLKAKTFGVLKGAVGAGRLKQPMNISIEPDGTKYVTDPGRGQVVVFDRNDEYVKALGAPGNWRPVDAAPLEGRLYVADVQNGLVKVFDKQSGGMIKVIGDKGAPSERLDRPTNLAFDREGYLYVTDFGRFQVLKFDRDGHFKMTFGLPGDTPGHFARPKGIALDRDDRLYAADASFNNVQIFNKEGRLLMFFGENGNQPGGLLLPAKVAIDYDNVQSFQQYVSPNFQVEYLVLVTSQFGERRVNVFAYGQEKGTPYPTDAELLKEIDERRKRELEKVQPQQPQ